MSDCSKELGTDPFDLSNTQLRSLQSGIPGSIELTADMKSDKMDGEKWLKELKQQYIYSKKVT